MNEVMDLEGRELKVLLKCVEITGVSECEFGECMHPPKHLNSSMDLEEKPPVFTNNHPQERKGRRIFI